MSLFFNNKGDGPVTSPNGRRLVVPSALTGDFINYFIPDDAGDILSRYGPRHPDQDFPPIKYSCFMPLLHCVALRGNGLTRDSKFETAVANLGWNPRSIRTVDDLISIRDSIDNKPASLREENVLSRRAHYGSGAFHYVPYGCLKEKLHELAQFLAIGTEGHIDLSAAIAHYVSIHLHPFLDGNGRWSRLLILNHESTVRNRSITHALFASTCTKAFVDMLWEDVRRNGFSLYLERLNDLPRDFRTA